MRARPQKTHQQKLPDSGLLRCVDDIPRTFDVDLATTERLRPMIPPEHTVIAESGIFTSDDIRRLQGIGVDAVLIGEALVTAPDPAAKIRELLG